ncbi:MAG: phosphate ABC transporter substrate-binding/OmpA family protein [Myxococcota bacterium]|jgi:ABC-type nitrate/sulfonate/bicarbonate transport system substrate-binding protein|nr:phosphate ABC transporter substrate-binding/OmpA family protein [Myxococcota bacterium]
MNGKPKVGFWIIVGIVVLGLAGFALYKAGILAPMGKQDDLVSIDANELKNIQTGGDKAAEAPDSNAPTTVKEYEFVPSAKLPPVAGTAGYQPLKDNTVRFAINVWAGWAPIVHANGGFKAGKPWVTPSGKKFKVELVLIDDPVAMRDAYATGTVHIGWATLDMVPLFLEEMRKDSRVMPRIYQQIDWSNGGDGIVGRGVENIGQLRGKTVVLAQNSPSHYFLLNALINAGVQPAEVNFKFTADAFQAAAAFNADKNIAAVVSWAPDIYNLSKVPGNKLIVSTQTANKLIADVWFARADFASENPEIIEGLVRGIFDAMEALKADAAKQQVAKLLASGYSIPPDEALGMLGDAHSTNYAENREFFMNQNNPTNFERTWETAYYLYKKIGQVTEKTPFDQVMDFSLIKKLGNDPKYASQKDEYSVNFAPRSVSTIKAESGEILTKTVIVQFFPNSFELEKKIQKIEKGQTIDVLYDPNVPFVLEEIGKLAGQYGAARIVIEGHTDASMKGQIPFEMVQLLSMNRANAVKTSLLQKFKTMQPNQFSVEGMGWNVSADTGDPNNHAKNRRVEVKVYPLEAM